MPSRLPAPARLSMTICWPSDFDNRSPSIRPSTSELPPTAYGTMSVMGRSGYGSAASAEPASAMTAAKASFTGIPIDRQAAAMAYDMLAGYQMQRMKRRVLG